MRGAPSASMPSSAWRALDPAEYAVVIVHLGEQPGRIAEAATAGVKSVPALVMEGNPYHINFGAALSDLGGGA